jgi:hypothetical protein
MDEWKLLDLLEKRALFFCRVDKLPDAAEATLPLANRRLSTLFGLNWIEPGSERAEAAFQFKHQMYQSMRRHIVVNCWRLGDQESSEMWAAYTSGPNAVMLRSTFQDLAAAFRTTPKRVFLSAVTYLDPNVVPADETGLENIAFRKTTRYAHEAELRALTSAMPDQLTPDAYWQDQVESGLHVAVDIERLISHVVTSPLAQPGYSDAIRHMLRLAGLSAHVRGSRLVREGRSSF